MPEMPLYLCHKKVRALEIAEVNLDEPGGVRFIFKEPGFPPVECGLVGDARIARYMPAVGDFYVVYDDGYTSFSPRKAFLEGYSLVGQSFAEIKQGLKDKK